MSPLHLDPDKLAQIHAHYASYGQAIAQCYQPETGKIVLTPRLFKKAFSLDRVQIDHALLEGLGALRHETEVYHLTPFPRLRRGQP